MTAESASSEIPDRCYRCDYDLRGIADDQPCPECGLLALRSRRETDELHNTRPKWLRRISRGVWMILLAIIILLVWPFVIEPVYPMVSGRIPPSRYVLAPASSQTVPLGNQLNPPGWPPRGYIIVPPPFWAVLLSNILPIFGEDAAAIFLLFGAVLLSGRERYASADEADKRLRLWLMLAAAMPLFDLIGFHAIGLWSNQWTFAQTMAMRWLLPLIVLLTTVPLPLLLFLQLRSLAKRARSAHLAEHCAIVGTGASAALLYLAAVMIVSEYAESWGLDRFWVSRSTVFLLLMVFGGTAAGLFLLWALYLLIRFAIAFHKAARELQRKWKRDDRALAPSA